MIRIGLDLHGVVDEDPKFFTDLSALMLENENEVYIVTGREECSGLNKELSLLGMENEGGKLYNGILSITTYQKGIGTPIAYLNGRKSQPMMDPRIWNPTKAMLCATAGINIMIDDSAIYEEFFRDIKTQYIIYTPEIKHFLKEMFYYGGI